MTERLQKILESKRALRQELASRPIEEKLRMLDELRLRTTISPYAATHHSASGTDRHQS